MADLKEIRKAKSDVKARIRKMVQEDPNVGPYEFLIGQIEARGVKITDTKDKKQVKTALDSLSFKDRREVKKTQKIYNEEYLKSIEELKKGNFDLIKKLPGGLGEIIAKGAGLGASAAGIVNTIAPNLFPTLLGYAAGSMDLSPLVKLGLVSLGAFSTPHLAQGAILAVGAVAGVAVYPIAKGIVNGAKALREKAVDNKVKKLKDDNER